MVTSNLGELSRTLVQLRLLTPQQLEDCLMELGHTVHDAEPLLEILERRGLLSAYQVGQLRKGETSGLVLGDYALLYQNASGSFARVYRARSLVDGQMVGLKLLRSRWAKDPKAVAQFRREAQLGKTLKHENIVPIYEVGQDGDQHFLTMEFVEGGNLREFLNIRKKLSPAEATKCTLEMALGLNYALGRGLTHRDLKMTNVLMSSRGVAKLVDFGLAGLETGNEANSGEGAQRALEYATLEKGTNAPRNDPRSDLFFLGAIYYELLTGTPPLPRTRDRAERSRFTRYSNVRPITQIAPELPRSITAIVERLMQINPLRRYQNPGEVVVDLRAALQELGEGTPAAAQSESPANKAAAPPSVATIMCIESRQKHQDVLRQYLTKHGYRVLMLSDLQRGLSRARQNPPDCLLVMAEALGEDGPQSFEDFGLPTPRTVPACLVVLPEKRRDSRDGFHETEIDRVLMQPLSLRELHRAIRQALRNCGVQLPEAKAEAGN